MLGALRGSLNTWPVRILFLVLVFAFGIWGVGDVVRNMRSETWVARVAGKTVELEQAQDAFQRQLAQVTRMFGNTEPTPEIRRSVADQVLQQLVIQAALSAEVASLGLAVPDNALRQAIFDIPAFKGPDGKFSRPQFEQVLRNNGLYETRFMELMRSDLGQRQLLTPVRAGASPSEVLLKEVFAFQQEKRSADLVEFSFLAQPVPAAPEEAVLQRWYDNHPEEFSTPELRKIKAVVLSPESIAKDLTVTDEELKAAYDSHRAQFVTPGKRSAQVIMVQDEAKARALADAWRAGADWAKMQADAAAAGGSAVQLDDSAQDAFPSPDLGAAVFAAKPDTVTEPVKGPLGWAVLKVVKDSPGLNRPFDEVKEELRAEMLRQRATDLMYDRANQVDGLLGQGTKLDELPNDLGLAAVQGTLTAQGNTAAGEPAPIPGPAELRQAIIAAAFQLRPGDPPHLTEVATPSVGGSAYYALTVDDILPPAHEPYDAVKDRVLESWTHDAIRREANEAASKFLAAIQGGQSLADAATVAGVQVTRTGLTGRSAPAEGVPAELIQPLFALKAPGEATMIETNDGFLVASLAEVQLPDPAADPAGFGQLKDALTKSVGDDLELTFALALRDRGKPEVNRALLDSIVQPNQSNGP